MEVSRGPGMQTLPQQYGNDFFFNGWVSNYTCYLGCQPSLLLSQERGPKGGIHARADLSAACFRYIGNHRALKKKKPQRKASNETRVGDGRKTTPRPPPFADLDQIGLLPGLPKRPPNTRRAGRRCDCLQKLTLSP